ncbi:MAG: lipoyl(octanoyl) transferase LipB [Desulfitobacteriaceae bacterium]
MNIVCEIKEPGTVSYADGLALQAQCAARVKQGELAGALILLQHTPVYTVGRAGAWENILISPDQLKQKGIDVQETNRGGNVTYHGPGQIVGYPILNLALWEKDVHAYMRNLEEVMIRTLKNLGVEAGRKPEYPGVWVGNRKIAAVGVAVKNWVTMHGFSFQITKESLANFCYINPCGITEYDVVALEEFIVDITVDEVAILLKRAFTSVFKCKLHLKEED